MQNYSMQAPQNLVFVTPYGNNNSLLIQMVDRTTNEKLKSVAKFFAKKPLYAKDSPVERIIRNNKYIKNNFAQTQLDQLNSNDIESAINNDIMSFTVKDKITTYEKTAFPLSKQQIDTLKLPLFIPSYIPRFASCTRGSHGVLQIMPYIKPYGDKFPNVLLPFASLSGKSDEVKAKFVENFCYHFINPENGVPQNMLTVFNKTNRVNSKYLPQDIWAMVQLNQLGTATLYDRLNVKTPQVQFVIAHNNLFGVIKNEVIISLLQENYAQNSISSQFALKVF
jgi:hypothetical protein